MTSCATDSGTETLFSDDSPCELINSPSISGDERTACPSRQTNEDTRSVNSRLEPPNIQPYSGVLERGKTVIRPIAFKPTMTPSSRFSDRYGSTPILTRPGSRMTLYGSTSDLHRPPAASTIDRKRSSCTSTNSSPPLAMSSLPSIPHTHKLLNYNSLESVRKSPSLLNKAYRFSTSNLGSLLDLTPSPSDSGVSELEAALRERDSELAYLRQTMEHNEQVIFRVYQEKEKVWERELHRMKTVHENRLRATTQKALKLEQMLMMQSFQQGQEKKRLIAEVQHLNFQNDQLTREVSDLRSRLEETEWGLCQKTGEIALLKTQIKDSQTEQTTKCQELLQLRNELREVQQHLDDKSIEMSDLQLEVETLRCQLKKYESMNSIDKTEDETERLKAEIKELREELSDLSISDYSNVQPGRLKPPENVEEYSSLEDAEIQDINAEYIECFSEDRLRMELRTKNKEFEREKMVWAHEKEKVLRYQRQLQMNYVQIYRRCKALEEQLESLTLSIALQESEDQKDLETIEL